MLQIGQMVGNYRVLRTIGRGGMGEVFEAVQQYIDRRAAIKVLYRDLSQNPQFVTRFLNEARAVNLARHPGLVEVYEFGLLPDGTAYIVMEFLEGEPLGRRMARLGPGLHAGDLELMAQIARALQAAHDRGIIHRDLKPDNVMIVPDPARPGREQAKIVDFGIAKLAESDVGPVGARYKTQTGVALGTPEYMAPEQCLGQTGIDGKVDVYALGVLAYELIAGELPFQGELAAEIVIMHVREAPPPLQRRAPRTPPALSALVHEMLAKDPAQRPSMAQVAERLGAIDLEDWEDVTAVLGAREPGAAPTQRSEIATPGPEDRSTTRPDVPRLRRGAVLALLGGAGLAAALGLLLLRGAAATAPRGAVCEIRSAPPGARVLRARDGATLGETPLRAEQPAGSPPLAVLLRREGFAEQALTLEFQPGCERDVALTPLPPLTQAPGTTTAPGTAPGAATTTAPGTAAAPVAPPAAARPRARVTPRPTPKPAVRPEPPREPSVRIPIIR